MMSFEEKYTAWLDGALDTAEESAFERELPDRETALRDREEWRKLRGGLREAVAPAKMPHMDFVNSQVLDAIRREENGADRGSTQGSAALFPLRRLAFAGGFLVVLAAVLSAVFITQFYNPGPTSTEIVSARGANKARTYAYTFDAPDKASVLWIDNAGYIPDTERL